MVINVHQPLDPNLQGLHRDTFKLKIGANRYNGTLQVVPGPKRLVREVSSFRNIFYEFSASYCFTTRLIEDMNLLDHYLCSLQFD